MADIADDLTTLAPAPQSVTVDGQAVVERPLRDVIEADAYVLAKQAASKRGRGLRFTRLIGPPQCGPTGQ